MFTLEVTPFEEVEAVLYTGFVTLVFVRTYASVEKAGKRQSECGGERKRMA